MLKAGVEGIHEGANNADLNLKALGVTILTSQKRYPKCTYERDFSSQSHQGWGGLSAQRKNLQDANNVIPDLDL